MIYTIVENCKRHGVLVEAYLRDLLTRLTSTTDAQTIATLTPQASPPPAVENQMRRNVEWRGRVYSPYVQTTEPARQIFLIVSAG